MEDSILESIKYFRLFNYPPNEQEIYCFLKKQASFGRFLAILEKMRKKGDVTTITKQISNSSRYTLGEYGIKEVKSSKLKVQNYLRRQANSIKKLNSWRFKLYLKLINLFPQIKLVGLSGSISMMNATGDDDIDLFIITKKKRLFTGRCIALLLAQLLNLRRKRIADYPYRVNGLRIKEKNKVCLNLFFDESDLAVPKFKRTEYVAHEVLQMKPMINKSYTYERFLYVNRWIKDLFPNTSGLISNIKYQRSKRHIKNKKISSYFICIFNILFLIFNIVQDWIEYLLKRLQHYFINKHITSEIISSTQLWFHPTDFGKKLASSRS